MHRRAIDDNDVKILQREVLADKVMTRDAIDVLVALDRAVPAKSASFAEYLVALVVDFAVWESRPTGLIDREKAHWLVTTLSAGEGPTPAAERIAFETVREADRCDESLIAFAMRKRAHPAAGVSGEWRRVQG